MGRLHEDAAARILRSGGVVAYPTEAVFGIGCLPDRRDAVERVLAIKGRSERKGLVLIAADVSQLAPYATLPDGPRAAEVLATWPGPVTWVLPAARGAPRWITGGRRTVAVRVTAHPVARRLCERAGSALVSTSANRAGRRPLKRALAVRRLLGREVDYVLPGPLGGLDRPTTIRDAATGRTLRA
ncbi:MAG TPA: L-threonylcarbamoyladenylate synthase [Gammaproteobacteria bacterium]